MYEIRKGNGWYRIYDKNNNRYVAHSKQKHQAEKYINHLKKHGFEGNIPAFFFAGQEKYGTKLLSH